MRQNSSIGDRYDLDGLLGSGGMGYVYRARDKELGREVAIKVLGQHHAETPEFVERFEREVRNVASLDHPNIIRVFDSGKDDDGSPYMAMELAEGGTLKDRIRATGPLSPREAARVTLQAAEALGAAHDAGIVHRDVKPENVLLTHDDEVKVADFGIARATEATAMTHTSMILGTAPYLSPEQAKGEPVGPESDLYSLGVVLYEALTGRTPFGDGEDTNPLAIAMKHCNEPAPAPGSTNPGVPESLDLITLTLLRKRPEERYPDAYTLADDLAAFLEGKSLSSKSAALVAAAPDNARTGVMRRAPVTRRRRRMVVPVMAVTLAGVLALAFSPLLPMERPVSLVEDTVAPDTPSLDRAVSPALQTHPGAPDAPAEERAQAPEPEKQDSDPQTSGAPTPDTPPEPAAPTETTPASAPASASAAASTSSPTSDDASAVATEEAPEPTPEPAAPSSAPAAEEIPEPQAVPAPAAAAQADDAGVEVPEVRVPDVKVPDF